MRVASTISIATLSNQRSRQAWVCCLYAVLSSALRGRALLRLRSRRGGSLTSNDSLLQLLNAGPCLSTTTPPSQPGHPRRRLHCGAAVVPLGSLASVASACARSARRTVPLRGPLGLSSESTPTLSDSSGAYGTTPSSRASASQLRNGNAPRFQASLPGPHPSGSSMLMRRNDVSTVRVRDRDTSLSRSALHRTACLP
jgi:hypothetical protein